MENKVFMPPPPKNLRNMPPPPPPKAEARTAQIAAKEGNVDVQRKIEGNQSNETVQAKSKTEVKKVDNSGPKVETVTEIERSSQNETAKKVEKSSGGSKFLYWGGFVLCIVAMAAAIYMLITL